MMPTGTDTDWAGDEGDTENEFSNGRQRKSLRKTFGKKPGRYGEWQETMTRQVRESSELTREKLQTLDKENPLHTIGSTSHSRPSSNNGSIRSMRTTSSMTRRRIQEAELAAAKKAAHLEEKLEMERLKDLEEARKRKLERENKLIQMQLDMEKDQIEDESTDDRSLRSQSTFSNKTKNLRRYNKLIGNDANENAEMRENVVKNDNLTSSMDAFLTSMSNLFDSKLNKSSETQDMKKFLARQTTSKFLPDFDGNLEEWPTFISRFRSSTESCGFSNVENLDRLQKCLKGKAKDAVQAMMYSSENVEKIIETLEMSFGRPQLIIKILMKKTKDMTSPTEERPTTLIEFSNSIQNLLSTMEALKCTSQKRNPQLLEDLVMKLPANMKMDWGKHIRSLLEEETLNDFAEWMKNIALSASRIQHLENHEKSYRHEEKIWKSQPKPEKIFTTPVYSKEKSNEAKKCLFCDRIGHNIVDCKAFIHENPDNRWKFATGKRICFSCLQNGHHTTQCQKKVLCGIENCKLSHHTLLHNHNASKEKTEPTIHITDTKKVEEKALLMICPVILSGPNGKLKTHALLDSGATGTYLDASIAKKLGLNGEKKKLNMKWFNDMIAKEYDSLQVDLKISTFDEKETFNLRKVKTIKNMDLPRQTVNVEELTKTWKHLKKFPELSLSNAKPTILIGQDHTHLIIGRETIENKENGPVITKTKLGWILHGNVTKSQSNIETEDFLHVNECIDDELHKLVKQSFSTEDFGVKYTQHIPKSKNELRAQQMIDTFTRRIGERWETCLLWKNDNVVLPESKMYAFSRLKSMERKMDKDDNFKLRYSEKIQDFVDKNYARKLTPEESAVETERTWYLPHFGVINPKKPEKLRFVFDCAAKVKGVSLNDALLTGPDLLCPLIEVLFKFRQRKIGFTADIKEMFPQVVIRKEDRNSQRFLWRGEDRYRLPDVYEMTSMTFGATCSPCLAQAVKNKNADEFMDVFPDAVTAIKERHYVDDYLDSSNNETEAIKLIHDVTEIHKRGGFVICNWICNSKTVLQTIPPDLLSTTNKNLDMDSEMSVERVLGIKWNPNDDKFFFYFKFDNIDKDILSGNKCPTKREVLKIEASSYDPLGFIAHFIIKAKILLQDIWRSGIDWDETIYSSEYEKWKLWIKELPNIQTMKIPRCYCMKMNNAISIQLHTFTDASKKAFAAVSYIRVDTGETVYTSFVMSKTRVAPLRTKSIPKLELQGALMGTRLAITIKGGHNIKIDKEFFWTDSKIVLDQIKSETRKYDTFTANRIGEILENSEISDWNWISTDENFADEATRDDKQCNFNNDSRWLNGPAFLKLPESEWPESKKYTLDETDIEEIERSYVNVITTQRDDTFEWNRYSSLIKPIRMTAWILRFVYNCKNNENRKTMTLSVDELDMAKDFLLKIAQKECYVEELQYLRQKKRVPNSSKLFSLSPTINEKGLLCLRSRLQKSPEINEYTKMPVILDPKHPVTKLLIDDYHKQVSHHGQELVVNELRQRYWIIDIRTAVRSAWNRCQVCKNARAVPKIPEMGCLPLCRVIRPQRPFTFVGMDYFGPISVTVGRRTEKRYGVIFTCLSVRAIHLEIANSLTTDSAIMAIRRMIGRRGDPEEIYSDNGTNLRGASNELKKALKELNQDKITDDLSIKGIKWKFIPPLSPHFGGSWERLIRSVKESLNVVLKERAPREEVLHTLFIEVENIINSRPLTHVSIDPDDLESITPNHFLIGTSSAAQQPGKFSNTDFCLRKQWRIAQQLSNQFWQRWVSEYLPSLARRTKWHKSTEPLKIGDIVIIADETLERNCWPKGIIVKVYPGTDKQVRVVDVKTSAGIMKRSAAKICRLDVDSIVK